MTTKPVTQSTDRSEDRSTQETAAQSPGQKTRPVRAVKIGPIQVAIWRNLTAEGRVVFNATLERLYYDEKAAKWESSTSFGRNDMLILAKAADVAHTAMCELHENANRRTAAVNDAGNTR